MTTDGGAVFSSVNGKRSSKHLGNVRYGSLMFIVEQELFLGMAQRCVTVQVSVFKSMCSIMCL